jgi:hypothetical protein
MGIFPDMSTGFIHNFSKDGFCDFVRFRETFPQNRETLKKAGVNL